MKILVVIAIMLSLSGCELLKSFKPELLESSESLEVVDVSLTKYCISQETITRFDEFCELDWWAEKLIVASTTPWLERSEMIDALALDPKSLIEKVLLSQGDDTPYRNRLRAQKWIEELQTLTDKKMTQVLDILIFQPSQQLLELESAITILSKVNGRQEKTLTAQEVQIAEKNQEIENQRKQVEQLLDIEASMVNQNRGDSK
ncbi:MAG: hypothetical protein ACI97K_001549 [Glaciecola sp.]|jgi:hypothetical protein